MPLFSAHYGLNKSQTQLDFVDIDTDDDIPLFIDPYVFGKSTDAWSLQCDESVLSFFEAVLEAIRGGNVARGRRLLDNLSEPNETCLGLSGGSLLVEASVDSRPTTSSGVSGRAGLRRLVFYLSSPIVNCLFRISAPTKFPTLQPILLDGT
jgi:hypothetical protein